MAAELHTIWSDEFSIQKPMSIKLFKLNNTGIRMIRALLSVSADGDSRIESLSYCHADKISISVWFRSTISGPFISYIKCVRLYETTSIVEMQDYGRYRLLPDAVLRSILCNNRACSNSNALWLTKVITQSTWLDGVAGWQIRTCGVLQHLLTKEEEDRQLGVTTEFITIHYDIRWPTHIIDYPQLMLALSSWILGE